MFGKGGGGGGGTPVMAWLLGGVGVGHRGWIDSSLYKGKIEVDV